ncbi:hypothetical protein TVAGG3_0096790 [Trichomonas vaginalis G3]|uniref:hypothetical protein n=1 Tax=Trichomonas vaginalis (strain ATCC PRA-98 / G3) TaxID=412133 RepID=UPI0021E5D623|nr:hypothetical protein TVAGG3_0457710 [Trichomonas vaginalis G3]XP_051107631.1 hypothetical protein TVAGG3_0096540 [Trichomonas vaginalis G3]XP_051107646.1 hypothetical protein TVAGG3_0096790 [Trichomonas vaginalis G3]KAI5514196.1 hypothetical protein TVAGG3_0457710 [Trichomonas vaginalis G3]KAI5544159.1 hypothetical protein TVAGG3_0096540 [Trichomonas vaginalis G3]KAI5544178.1 hypothetical protein TVAGG3_0096790 [Trichomonas vaginalis G3]
MFLLTLVLTRYEYNYFNCEPCIDRSSCKCKFGQYTVYGGKKDSGECALERELKFQTQLQQELSSYQRLV